MEQPNKIHEFEFDRMYDLLYRARAIVAGEDGRQQHEPAAEEDLLWVARKLLRERRERSKFLTGLSLGEPAWDMVLDLLAAEIMGKPISVSSACLAAQVPPTTALRYITTMTEHGLLRRRLCDHDARVVYVELSKQLSQAIRSYLTFVLRNSGRSLFAV